MLALSVIKAAAPRRQICMAWRLSKFFLCADGECLSYEAAYENGAKSFALISRARLSGYLDTQWTLIAYDVNWKTARCIARTLASELNRPMPIRFYARSARLERS